jgi:hypothetical protein
MKSRFFQHAVVALSCAGGAAATAGLLGGFLVATETIAVQAPLRPGLWETTYVNPNLERLRLRFLAKSQDLPADQQELMKQNVPGGDGGTKQVCLSAEGTMQIPIYEQRVKGCEAKTSWKGRKSITDFKCETGASGRAEIDYPDDKTYKGVMIMHDSMKSGRGSNRAELSGRWIKSDCGSVAPPSRADR